MVHMLSTTDSPYAKVTHHHWQMVVSAMQMVELEETFITQLQRVADTYKREMQEQHGMRSETEARLRAAQLAVHQADTQREHAQAALQALQVAVLLTGEGGVFCCQCMHPQLVVS